MGTNREQQFTTLTAAMEFAAGHTSNGICFIGERGTDTFTAYKDLLSDALKIAAGLQHSGLKKGDELIFQFQDNQSFITTFWACLFAGIIPVPLSLGVSEEQKQKVSRLWHKLNNPFLIADGTRTAETPEIATRTLQLEALLALENPVFQPVELTGSDIAFIQFSSGSTGSPKGVTLTHANLLANVDAIHKGIHSPEEGDSFFSWMPLTHDMGLIGFHLTPLFKAWTHYIMPTSMFIRNPISWLRKIEQYGITFTSSPNFGYQYVLKHIQRGGPESQTYDLSSLRIIVNGAEPISAALCDEFTQQMAVFGLKENVIFPVYGLAEASLAVTFSDWQKTVSSVRIKRDSLGMGDTVQLVEADENGAIFVNVGSAISHCEIRITGADGNPLEDQQIGRIEIRGANVTTGYYNEPEINRQIISPNGWLNTGDLGFISDGDLFVTGRIKDVLFVNGQNFYAHDLERTIELLDDMEPGKVVVCGYHDAALRRDAIAVFILYKGQLSSFIPIAAAIRNILGEHTGLLPDYILPVRKIPKTTSGKVQRYALSAAMLDGTFEAEIRELQQFETEKATGLFSDWNERDREIGLIWQQILGHSDFDRDTNFFTIGGNSLKAGEACTMIADRLQLHLTLADFFKCRTIAEIASILYESNSVAQREFVSQGEMVTSPLSNGQQNIYYFAQAFPESSAYTIPTLLQLERTVQPERLEAALQKLIDRHRILRTRFIAGEEEPLQFTEQHLTGKLTFISTGEEDLQATLRKQVRPFDLTQLPLFECILAEHPANNSQYLLFNIHHIIADGTTVELLVSELFDLYNELQLEPVNYHFTDLIHYERQIAEDHVPFWADYLAGSQVLELPADHHRPPVFSHEGTKLRLAVPPGITEQLTAFCSLHSTTPFPVLLSSYIVLLNAFSGQDDFTVGVPLNSRNTFSARNIAGMFVNNLIFRCRPEAQKSFLELVRDVQNEFLLLFDKGHYNATALSGQLGKVRELSRNPLFDVMFVYQNSAVQSGKESTKDYHLEMFDAGTAKYDLTLEVVERNGAFDFYLEYNSHLFTPQTIAKFSGYYEALLESALQEPHSLINSLNKPSYQDALMEGDASSLPFENLCQALLHSAEKMPDRTAISTTGGSISYASLVQRSKHLAACLVENGITEGDRIMLLMDKTPEFVTAVIAVLLVGGCFVPVDPELPENRIRLIYEDSGSRMVIASRSSDAAFNIPVCTIDELEKSAGIAVLPATLPSTSLAYMIYTSGTTGRPKGVMIEHGAALNYCLWAAKTYFTKPVHTIPLYTSVSFDLTITSLLPPLLSGNTIATYDSREQLSVFSQLLKDEQVNVIKATPSHLKLFLEITESNYLPAAKTFIVGGEDLPSDLAARIVQLFGPDTVIYNEYGPTEATVGCMIRKYSPEKDLDRSVPIGKPICNTSLLVLDKHLVPVPDGAIGELLIGGSGLAKGYRNNQQLTEERFITIPELNNGRFYHSGDLVKRNRNGELVYLGRSDEQVKINGFRIELAEIEQCIKKIPEIEEAIVCLKQEGAQDPIMCTYYVTTSEVGFFHERNIKEHLQKILPAYMIPACYVAIPQIPLTVNGKVALNQLPDPFKVTSERTTREPNEQEKEVIAVWKSVFKTEREISVEDHFFRLGGDSIKAIQVVSALHSKGFKTRVNDVMQFPEIESFAGKIERTETLSHQGPLTGDAGITPIFQWFMDLKLDRPQYYNQSVVLKLEKAVAVHDLEQAFNRLIQHHDALRLNVDPTTGRLFFNPAHLQASFSLETPAFSTDAAEEDVIPAVGVKLKETMDLQQGLLIKGALISFGETRRYLLITCHHVLIDGVSWRILLEDLYTLLSHSAARLPAKTASVKDWSDYVCSEPIIHSMKKNWTDQAMDSLVAAQEPMQKKNRADYQFSYPEEPMQELFNTAMQLYKANPEIVLLTIMLRALSGLDGYRKRLVELERHGRSVEAINISRTVGWFTTVCPVITDLTETQPADEQLLYVKELVNTIPDNGMGFGILRMNEGKELALFPELRLNYLGQFNHELDNDVFSFSEQNSGADNAPENRPTAKLEINCMLLAGEFRVQVVSAESSFSRDRIFLLEKSIGRQTEQLVAALQKDGNAGRFTPSDFKLSDLAQDELDQLFIE